MHLNRIGALVIAGLLGCGADGDDSSGTADAGDDDPRTLSDGGAAAPDATAAAPDPDAAAPDPDAAAPDATAAAPDATASPPQTGDWIALPGGRFRMGTNGGNDWETPTHDVDLPAFEMARTEVTVAEYRRCVDAGVCGVPGPGDACNWGDAGHDDYPVNCVDWEDARTYAGFVGGGARLPSEAEWEYAARAGGRDQEYPWGDAAPDCDRARYGQCGLGTVAVCSLSDRTAQGVCDLGGNVNEWVEDWFHLSYVGAPTDGSAWVEPVGEDRVIRGAGWYSDVFWLRGRSRAYANPLDRAENSGIRLL